MEPGYIQWLRSHIGPQKTLVAYTTALIRDEEGRLLFQRRTDFSWWGLPGGMIEIGETFRQCGIREAFEETGWQVEPHRLIGIYASPEWDFRYPNGDEVQQFTVALECRIVGGSSRADGVESENQQFFPLSAIPSPCAPWYEAMIRDLREKQAPYVDPPIISMMEESYIWPLRRLVGTGRIVTMGAAALIQNDTGQVLLGLRADSRTWGLPAGLMELGETPAGTIIREAFEELRLHIEPTQLLGVFTGPESFHTYPDGNQVQLIATLFRARIIDGVPAPDGTETLDARWFSSSDLPLMPARHRRMLHMALAHPEGGLFE
jgi:8-oxo-dGTP pyrophosphatase MutT (NUDIX family)